MSGHGWGPGDERKRAIADLANAMQAVSGLVAEMSRDELEQLFEKLGRMAAIVSHCVAAKQEAPAAKAPAKPGSVHSLEDARRRKEPR